MIAKVQIKKLNPKAFIPLYMSPGDAGCDVCACLDNDIELFPGERVVVPTGLAFAIQDGFECQVRSRSGLALKSGVIVLNAPGTIDSGYRGELKVVLHNTNPKHVWNGYHEVPNPPFQIVHGMRIAQLVFAPVAQAFFSPCDELPESERGKGGFGSTGV
jgi:dUTP pyrophosphatase